MLKIANGQHVYLTWPESLVIAGEYILDNPLFFWSDQKKQVSPRTPQETPLRTQSEGGCCPQMSTEPEVF